MMGKYSFYFVETLFLVLIKMNVERLWFGSNGLMGGGKEGGIDGTNAVSFRHEVNWNSVIFLLSTKAYRPIACVAALFGVQKKKRRYAG